MFWSSRVEESNPISGNKKETLLFEVAGEAEGERLDSFLARKMAGLTRSQIKRLIEKGNVYLEGGTTVKSGYRLKRGERIAVTIPEAEPIEARPEKIPLSVLYEDHSIIVIDKPAGMVVHPAPGHYSGTLVNALLYHCEDLSGIGGKLRPGIVHRLDKDTSGVMLATKNDHAHNMMARQFKAHTIVRKYKALVYGTMESEGSIDRPLGRHPARRKEISIVSTGRRAVTHWKVLKYFQGITLLELTLETGRTHQIRVHLSQAGHPVVGDRTYGSDKRANEIKSSFVRSRVLKLERQALHAYLLGFKHPSTGEYMEFKSPLPKDIEDVINALDKTC